MTKRIGIFSGVFDPVHAGHIGFALEAARKANLDTVYLLIEAKPRRKAGVTHLAHRLAMAKLATVAHAKLEVLELPDSQFSVSKTLPRLKKRFPGDELVLLVGSDTLEHMAQWPLIDRLLEQMELVVGCRFDTPSQLVKQLISTLPAKPQKLHILLSPYPQFSSGQIRQAIKTHHDTSQVLPSLRTYITNNWLYVSPSASSSRSSS